MDIAQLKLRPATDQDRDAIVRLISDALQEYSLPLYLDTMDSDLNDIRGSYEAAGGFFDVLEGAQGEIAGCVGLRPAAGPTCELRRMYLKASWRGKGLGKRLLARGKAAAVVVQQSRPQRPALAPAGAGELDRGLELLATLEAQARRCDLLNMHRR